MSSTFDTPPAVNSSLLTTKLPNQSFGVAKLRFSPSDFFLGQVHAAAIADFESGWKFAQTVELVARPRAASHRPVQRCPWHVRLVRNPDGKYGDRP
jgi:hypothetical protein